MEGFFRGGGGGGGGEFKRAAVALANCLGMFGVCYWRQFCIGWGPGWSGAQRSSASRRLEACKIQSCLSVSWRLSASGRVR